jgi:heptosyltransferase-1
MAGDRILVVRMGAMGDILHTLPAVAALGRVTWMIKPQWLPLIEGNPAVAGVRTAPAWGGFDRAYDFQGLIKSAVFARMAARETAGFDTPREKAARWFYARRVARAGAHVVEHNLALAGASGPARFWIPEGREEGRLPEGPFVLACPLAGWGAKQWPMANYRELAKMIPAPLILNGPPGSGLDHESSLAGLIHATRRAAAIVGVDSGPLHLAAALGKPGVAIYGPTDPARNGPYGGTIRVLRDARASTTYRRTDEPAASMLAVTPAMAAAELARIL